MTATDENVSLVLLCAARDINHGNPVQVQLATDMVAIIAELRIRIKEAEARIKKALSALDFDGERDAADNLLGAHIDLKRANADQICLDTIERVMGQIAEACAALSKEKPE